jgi:alkanesulfonate monooxygenase SsuD/methylene tetrahydromethanopterin reductase-like flavin-dependent oxidoreductase (luciferase family)
MIIDIQFSPAVEPWERLRDGVLLAEQVGFDTTWVFDHFAGNVLAGGTTMIECFTLLGALSAATTTIGLGTLVVNVANRNPGVMALSAASVQAVSGGRFTLGLGAGAAPNTAWSIEHGLLAIGLEPTVALRHRRLQAALDEVERLWSPDRAAELDAFPRADPRPPVILGVNSVALAAIAGQRCDGMNVRSSHDDLAALIDAGRQAHAQRTDAATARPFDVSVWANWDPSLADPEQPDRRRWAQMGVDRLVLVWLQPHDPAAVAAFDPTP